tara:strand:+ start:12407 stop:13339 length:933 start_codon:yes stop_codon:yes gene_type:complete
MIINTKRESFIKAILTHSLKLIAGLSIIVWLSTKDIFDFSSFRLFFQPLPLLLLSICFLCFHLLQSLRLQALFLKKESLPNLKDVFYYNSLGLFFNFLAPGGVGGDIFKGFLLSRKYHYKKRYTYSVLLYDRILGLVSFSILGLLSAIFVRDAVFRFSWSTVIYSSFFLFVLFYFFGKVLLPIIQFPWQKLQTVLDFLRPMLQRPKTKIIAISCLAQIFLIIFFLVGIYISNHQIPYWGLFLFLIPTTMTISFLPISPGGIGVGQAAIYYVFHAYQPEYAKICVTLISLLQFLQFLTGAIAYLIFTFQKK